jgi:hypothetical protein
MAKILHETLLLSCMAAFAIGLVLAVQAYSARRGTTGAVPPACAWVLARPGAHSLFLLVSRENVPWGICRGEAPSHQNNARPARVVPGSEGTRASLGCGFCQGGLLEAPVQSACACGHQS